MNRTILLTLLIAVAVPATGCMDTLKEAMGGEVVGDENVGQSSTNMTDNLNKTKLPTATGANATETFKPPVARITVFGASGALVYKADFVAANDTSNGIVTEVGTHSFLASDSEAVDGRARLEKFTWTIDGMKMTGRKIDHDFADPGVHMVSLTVEDSLGSKDEQMLHLSIMPQPFDVVTTGTGSTILNANCNADGEGNGVTEIVVPAQVDGKTVTLQGMVVTFAETPLVTSDYDTFLYNAEGTQIAAGANGGGVDGLTAGALSAGTYTLVVVNCLGIPGDYVVEITSTYLEVVEGLDHEATAHAH